MASDVSRCLPWIVSSKISTERENSVEIGGLGGPPFSNINNWKTSSMVSLPLRREVPTHHLCDNECLGPLRIGPRNSAATSKSKHEKNMKIGPM